MNPIVLKFLIDEDGVTSIEYGLVAALIGLLLATALLATGDSLLLLFNQLSDCLTIPRGALC